MDLNTQRINYVSVDDTELLNRVMATAHESWVDNNVLLNSGLVRTIELPQGAYSRRFKFRGKFSGNPEHHNRGQFIMGRTRPNAFTDIFVDRPLIEAEDIDEADADLSNYDEVQPSVRECIRTIAELTDRRCFRLGILGARTAGVTNVHSGGNVVQREAASIAAAYPLSSTGADNFAYDLGSLARLLDEDHAPEAGRTAFITPWIKQVLTFKPQLFSRDYNDPMIARYSERFVGRMEGFALITTRSHMPSTNVTDDLSKYNGNFTAGAASQRQPACLTLCGDGENFGIGEVVRSPLRTKVYMSEDHDAMRIQARVHQGLGVLWPPCCGEIGVATAA